MVCGEALRSWRERTNSPTAFTTTVARFFIEVLLNCHHERTCPRGTAFGCGCGKSRLLAPKSGARNDNSYAQSRLLHSLLLLGKPPLAARVVLLVHAVQPVERKVRVHLCSRDVG